MKTRNLLLCMAGLAALFLNATAAWADTAGHIQFVNGDVQVVSPGGMVRALRKGDAINEGDTISSAKDASAQVKMVDGGFIAVRQDTQLKFDSFKFSTRQGEPENSFFSLVKGSFRAVTGLIGRVNRQEYKITTPVATIGIRGTDHETAFVPNALPGVPAGAYSKVNLGETSLTTDVGSINVKPNQMGYARGMTHIPELLPINTNLFTVAVAPAKEPKVIGAKDKEDKGGGQGNHGTRTVEPPIRDTAVVDNTSEGAGIQAGIPIAPAVTDTAGITVTPPQTTIPVTLTDNSNPDLILDTTNQTVSSGDSTVPLQNGTFGIDAQIAADKALAAANAALGAASSAATDGTAIAGVSLVDTAPAVTAISTASPAVGTATALAPVPTTPASSAISTAAPAVTTASAAVTAAAALAPAPTAPVSTTIGTATTGISTANTAVSAATALAPVATSPISTAISTATPAVATASTVVTTAAALAPVNATTASANAAAAQAAATTAVAQAAAAQAALAANGQFADVTAVNATNNVILPAISTLQTANTAVQTDATTVTAQNAALTAAQSAAAAALATANANLTAANANLTTTTSQNAALTAAQLAAQNALTTATNNLATANSNLTTATSQNAALTTAQSAAAAALATANANLAAANANLTAAINQNATLTAAQLAAQNALATADTNLNAATAQNTAIAAAQSSAAAQLAAAQAAATAAQSAAIAAQAAADQAKALQTLGDFTGAQAQLKIAQDQLKIAQDQQAIAAAAQTVVSSQKTAALTAQFSGLNSVNDAVTAAITAQTQAATAQTAVTTANAAVTAAATDAAAAVSPATTAQTQAAAAQAASTAANAAVTTAATAAATAAGAVTTAQTQAAAAQAALTAANAAATAATTAATTAASAASTAQTKATTAQTANATANAAVTASSTNLATVNDKALIIATNAPIAAYNNPAIAGNFIGVTEMSVPVAGGFNAAFPPDNPPHPNTTYVLDGNGNLVEMRNSQFQVQSSPNGIVLTPNTIDADVKWSGGTGADAFKLADNSIYLGRWENATVTVTDNANPANVSTYTSADNIWLLLLPPPPGYVQSLVGTTTYTVAGNTIPVDAFGKLGVLNSATLSADFTRQLVTAGVDLTMPAASSMAGNFVLTGANLPINADGFSVNDFNPGTGTLTICINGTCSATGATGYSAELSGAFAGTAAASAAMGYHIWPSTTGSSPMANSVQGYVALTTTTAPTVLPGGPFAAFTATDTAVAYTGAFGGGFNFIAAPNEVTPTGNPTVFTESFGSGSSFGFRTDTLSGASTATPPTTTVNGITFGVWENVASVSSSDQMPIMPSQGSRQLPSYMYGEEGYLDSAVVTGVQTGPMSGVFTYTAVASTSNDPNTWASGSLTTKTMSADFTNQTVSVGLAGTMGANSWTADSTNMPINFGNTANGTGTSFQDPTPVITVNSLACSPNCGGNINGAFVGQNYAGAIVQYDVWDNNNGLNVGGLVGFSNDTPTGTGGTPTGTYVMSTGWLMEANPTAITTNAAGVLTGWSGPGWNSSVAPAAGSVAQTAVGTGSGTINWGLWSAGSVNTNNFSYVPGTAQFHWITAPEPTPVYLPEVLTTTATYNFVAGDVTSLSGGAHGTINSSSTSLTVNFATQSVAANLDLSVNGHSWLASTTDAPLQYLNSDSLNGFYADSYRLPSQPGYLTVTVDAAPANGNLAGQLVGPALDGAFLKFNLDGQVTTPTTGYEWVQGVAALGAAVPNDPLTPYKIAVALINDPLLMDGGNVEVGGYQAPANVVFNGSGNLIQLSGEKEVIVFSAGTAGSAFTGTGTPCNPCTDAVTGIQWGRWAPGVTATVTENGTTLPPVTIGGGGMHWIATPELSGPVTLPVSGTYAYTLAGGTNPTDSTGAAGTLNSATLSANFTAQTVDVGVNATVAATTINASATGVPIFKGALFDVDSSNGLTVGCTGTACSGAKGQITGGFGGAGAMGAVMMYGFMPNPAVANMIAGVAAFHR